MAFSPQSSFRSIFEQTPNNMPPIIGDYTNVHLYLIISPKANNGLKEESIPSSTGGPVTTTTNDPKRSQSGLSIIEGLLQWLAISYQRLIQNSPPRNGSAPPVLSCPIIEGDYLSFSAQGMSWMSYASIHTGASWYSRGNIYEADSLRNWGWEFWKHCSGNIEPKWTRFSHNYCASLKWICFTMWFCVYKDVFNLLICVYERRDGTVECGFSSSEGDVYATVQGIFKIMVV